jgi:EAL domain-containing protein (putative c-di-GMP-specific phosphodiesterase class I)
LRACGVKIALDDFGTGYSSLNYLRRLPIDTLKIDRSFISQLHLEESKDDRAIVCAIVMLARKLGMTLVAEGVETQGHVDVLRDLGCDQLQGFLYSKPMPAKSLDFSSIKPPLQAIKPLKG